MSESSESFPLPLPVAAPPAPPDDLWSAVREALRGSRRDYTEGSIGRSVLILAIPMVLEMVLESVFAVTDVFFVSRLGPAAVATVGLTESMISIVYSVAAGLSIGAAATVARRIGEKDPEGAARTAVQALALGAFVAAGLGVTGALLAPHLLALMGAPREVIAIGSGFTRVMLGGNATVLLLFLVNAVFRGAGDAAISMRVLWLANAINILLGPCLIFGLGPFPRLGVIGAAIATNIGRGTGVLFAVSQLIRGGRHLEVGRRHLHLDPAIMRRILQLSSSGTVQVLIATASWIGLVRILAAFGSDALAGYTITVRLVVFALLPAWGLSNAAATMVGQALGARKPERAEHAVWLTGTYNACFLGGVGLTFLFLAHPIIRLFTTDPSVSAYAVDGLRIVGLGFPLYAFGMVITQSFNGAGDTRTPTLLNLFVFWLWEIPLGWLLAVRLGLGPRGVFIAIAVAFSTLAIASAMLFRRGKWKTKRV